MALDTVGGEEMERRCASILRRGGGSTLVSVRGPLPTLTGMNASFVCVCVCVCWRGDEKASCLCSHALKAGAALARCPL